MSQKRDGDAKRILRAEMALHAVTYEILSARLGEIGVKETNASLRNKLSRGSFTADFFLQCLSALEVKTLRLVD